MSLPSYETATRRSKLVRDQVAAFAAARADDPVAWARLPRLARTADLNTSDPHEVPHELAADQVRRLREAESARASGPPAWAQACLLGQGCLLVSYNRNMRSSQAPLHDRFAPLRPPSPEIGAAPARTRALASHAVSLAEEFIGWARTQSLAIPVSSASIYRAFLRAANVLGYWENLVARESPKVVVVGTTSGARSRLLVHVAASNAIPSVYIPHAPLLNDPLRTDLPVDYVALRGREEASQLGERGVDESRLDVVGNPSISPEGKPDIDTSLRPTFAPSAQRRALLPSLIGLVAQGLGDEVTVSPPPELRAIADSTFPAGWRLWEGRTYDLLRAGIPVLMQHSSGTALEALSLGIPVIELSFPGKQATYPFIREPHVRFASDPQELRIAVADAVADAGTEARRDALVEWARSWAWPTGAEAAERMVSLVERAIRDGRRGPIWDSIRMGAGA